MFQRGYGCGTFLLHLLSHPADKTASGFWVYARGSETAASKRVCDVRHTPFVGILLFFSAVEVLDCNAHKAFRTGLDGFGLEDTLGAVQGVGLLAGVLLAECYTVKLFTEEHPHGTYILALSGHVVAVQDGNYFDAWDSGDEIPLYVWKEQKT